MGMQVGDRSGGPMADINVTPLVDVVLVLLIILMVTATAIVSKAIHVELPQAATGEHAPADLAVSINEQGQLYFNEEEVTLEHCLTVTGLHIVATVGAHDLFGSGLKMFAMISWPTGIFPP